MDAVDDDEIAGESAEHIPTPENFENHKSKHSFKQQGITIKKMSQLNPANRKQPQSRK